MRKFFLLILLLIIGCNPAQTTTSTSFINPGIETISVPSRTVLLLAANGKIESGLSQAEVAAKNESINPLTGLPVDDQAILNRRPILVKVSNYPRTGRPHAGLSSADIVFEYYIGEMFNRFLAIFYGSDSSQVGPIRSGRLVDSQLAQMFQGILVYGNADDRVDEILAQQLKERAVPTKFGVCPPICGTDTHDIAGIFVDTGYLSASAHDMGIDNTRPDLNGMYFQQAPPDEGLKADTLAVQYAKINRGEWHYDSESGTYLRWIEELDENDELYMAPLVDRNTGNQLSFSNIIILSTFYVEYNRTMHNIDLENNQIGQRALLFRDGNLYEGLWRSNGIDHPLQFLDQIGNPLPLKPGKTWVFLAGISSTFKETNPANWELLFYLP